MEINNELRKILDSYEDFELAFMYSYKISTYSKTTQLKIENYLKERGIKEEVRDELIEATLNYTFNDDDYRCPRCKSKKIRKDRLILSKNDRSAILDEYSGRQDYYIKEVCEICAFELNNPNFDDLKKESWWYRNIGKYFDVI